jgi:hypothetical protein
LSRIRPDVLFYGSARPRIKWHLLFPPLTPHVSATVLCAWSGPITTIEGGGKEMAMSTRKRFYLSVTWMAAVILGGLAMLLSFVTHT